jgi:hypothetical protein
MSIRMGLPHVPTGNGQGKWEDRASLWNYKLARRQAQKRAAASRAFNRRQRHVQGRQR